MELSKLILQSAEWGNLSCGNLQSNINLAGSPVIPEREAAGCMCFFNAGTPFVIVESEKLMWKIILQKTA